MPATLAQSLHELTVPGACFARRESDGAIRCWACGHECLIPEGKSGVCKVRHVEGGELRVPFGYTGGVAVDPIEKKPFFHVLPGSEALSFGMLGCDFKCGYCQNWLTSQTLRDESAGVAPRPVAARELAMLAQRHGCPVIVSTYNEPLITAEWARAVFEEARALGIRCGFVSNGNATPEVLDYLRPVLDLYKVDLKGFQKRSYAQLGGRLETVLQSIDGILERGLWLEVVTLVVPGFNDSTEELTQIAEFLAARSPDIPWHVTAFHTDYKFQDRRSTRADDLLRAHEIGKAAGLHFVYCGNRPGQLPGLEDTTCPGCGAALIRRVGFTVLGSLLKEGRCPGCGRAIPGVWT
ncbi:MAG: AmmeMemoRadiSam system radical SAM enzyme [Candidatus Sumerlaeia bacterium]|nr:AmmeMemoRadiSam system radical SAM enzyme [Candidatus Sumerlaeia bacterium]